MSALVLLGSLAIEAARPGSAAAADAPSSCSRVAYTSALGTWHTEAIAVSGDVDVFRFQTTRTAYALVTLGRPAANYKLELYNSSCRLITSSNRDGTLFEEIYRQLAAGTYYVVARPSSSQDYSSTTYQVRFVSLSDTAQVLSSSPAWRDYTASPGDTFDPCHINGGLHIAGEVLNNTTSRVYIRVNATYHDRNGVVIARGWAAAMSGSVGPRARAPFVLCSSVPSSYHHHRLSVSTTAPGPYDQTVQSNFALTTGPALSVPGTDGYRRQGGTVTNRNAFGVREVGVYMTLYDAWGRVIEADAAPIQKPQSNPGSNIPMWPGPRCGCTDRNLAPGESAPFEMVTYRHAGAADARFLVFGLR